MAKGRRPKPTEIKRAQGTEQPCRANPNEPKPRKGRPRCPGYLDKIARREWRRIVPEVEAMGVLSMTNGSTLEAYCLAYSMVVQMEGDCQEHGVSDEGKKRPEANMWKDALTQMRMYAVELGLTPASQSKIQVTPLTPGREKDDEDFLFSGPRKVG